MPTDRVEPDSAVISPSTRAVRPAAGWPGGRLARFPGRRRPCSLGFADAESDAVGRTESVTVPAEAFAGATADLQLTGDLTLHSVTKNVTIPAQARLVGSTIEVVGSLAFPFADFDIEPPNIAGFVSVHDEGTLEFKLVLTR